MPKYGKIKVVRKYDLDQGEYAVWMESYRQGTLLLWSMLNIRPSPVTRCRNKPFSCRRLRSPLYGNPLFSSKSTSPWNTHLLLY